MGHLDGGHERYVRVAWTKPGTLTANVSLSQIKAQSKVQLPLWLAFILIYSYVRISQPSERERRCTPSY
ncbi:hypothetical protein BJV74DRAFT_853445, partial [Russula compacta]